MENRGSTMVDPRFIRIGRIALAVLAWLNHQANSCPLLPVYGDVREGRATDSMYIGGS